MSYIIDVGHIMLVTLCVTMWYTEQFDIHAIRGKCAHKWKRMDKLYSKMGRNMDVIDYVLQSNIYNECIPFHRIRHSTVSDQFKDCANFNDPLVHLNICLSRANF